MIRGTRVEPLLISALGSLAGWAHAARPPPSPVSFVGCPSHSMTDGSPIAAPQGTPRTVTIASSMRVAKIYMLHCVTWSEVERCLDRGQRSSPYRATDRLRRIDERQMAQGLGQIAEHGTGFLVDLLAEQPQVLTRRAQ